MRVSREIAVEPNQEFTVDCLRPEDAAGVANVFYSVYGPHYPFDTFYVPEKLVAENEAGNIYSVVARTLKGDIIGHGALYRSSPEYPLLYELGQLVILMDYRHSFAALKILQYIYQELLLLTGLKGMFGEAVSNHITSQKMCTLANMKETAIEIGLMPAEMYDREKSAAGRVSCVFHFVIYEDRPHKIFIPACYRAEMDFIMSDMNLKRETIISSEGFPPDSESSINIKFFKPAGVGRFAIVSLGADFESRITEIEKAASGKGMKVLQFFINLENPASGKGVDILREHRYFLGGYLPRWFDSDGLLMQKLLVPPDFDSMNLYTEKSRELLRYVASDWKAVQ